MPSWLAIDKCQILSKLLDVHPAICVPPAILTPLSDWKLRKPPMGETSMTPP